MQRHLLLAVLALASLFAGVPRSQAQSALLNLPRASQRARVSQRVGITDINITYHRPLAAGRKIWGGIVPYGQPWRAGANENTLIEFTDPVTVEGQPLAAGKYGLHMIPGESDWIVAFSKTNTAWGSFSYDKAEDALRVTVKPHPSEMHEALTWDFDEVTPHSTTAVLKWEKLAIPFKIEVNTLELTQKSLTVQLRGIQQYTWVSWDQAANYLADNKGDLEAALKDADTSIQNEERFENLITKAKILDAMNRKDDAAAARKKAMDMGTVIQVHIYGRQLMAQGHQDQGFEVFRGNMKKYPNHWLAHGEAARIVSAKGDFETAAKEIKLSIAVAPEAQKASLNGMLKRLENKEDINK